MSPPANFKLAETARLHNSMNSRYEHLLWCSREYLEAETSTTPYSDGLA